MRSGKQESLRWILEGPDEDLTSDEHASARTSSLLAQQIVARYSLFWPEAVSANREHSPGNGAAQVCARATRTLTGWASRGPSTNPPFGQTGETSPSRDKLCLGGGPHADGACHCCSCVHRVRIDRGRTGAMPETMKSKSRSSDCSTSSRPPT